MPWSTPVTPVSGTVITVAWAQSSVVTPVNHLRAMTGAADPPAAGYSIESTGTTGTQWTEKVTRTGDVMRGDLQVNRAVVSQPTTGYLVLGNNTAWYVGFDGSKHVISTPELNVTGGPIRLPGQLQSILFAGGTGHRDDITGGTGGHQILVHRGSLVVYDVRDTSVMLQLDDDANIFAWKGQTIYHTGNAGAFVPSGLIAAFATAGAIAAGWSRYTAADGRLLVGAGTTFSQTFSENTAHGSSWADANTSSISGNPTTTVNFAGGGTPGAGPDHGHTINTSNVAWAPVARVVVWAQKS